MSCDGVEEVWVLVKSVGVFVDSLSYLLLLLEIILPFV